MRIDELKYKGFKIVTNWQDCNGKSIFLFYGNDYAKFIKYKTQALRKNCKFIICNESFKSKLKNEQNKFFFLKKSKILRKNCKYFLQF